MGQQRWRWMMAGGLIAAIILLLLFQIHDIRSKAVLLERHTAELNIRMRVLNHEIIGFSDPHAKEVCVSHWDADLDGELSYQEAAAVTSLGDVFTKDSVLRSFSELAYFTGLEDISPCAFWDCTRLETVTIPRTVRYIRQSAFRHTALQTVTIPSSVVAIGDDILEGCSQLETVIFESVLPNTNQNSHQLDNCPKLSAIFVPDYWLTVEDEKTSWRRLSHIIYKHIEFSDPVVKSICIRHWDRDGDKELSIDEAMAVTSLGAAFSGNASIRSFDELKYFTGLTEIDAGAFDRCTNLRSVRLPSSLKSIGHNAFLACSLRSVYIPSGVTSIAPTAFGSCWYLSRVEISSDNPVYDSRENCNAIIETRTNKMITGSVTAFIPRSVTSLSDECFNWFNRDELILPAQISHLGPWSLTSIFHRVYCESPIPPTFDSQDGAAYLFPHSDMGFTEPTVVKPKLLTKIVSVNGDSNGASKDEITLKYDANSRISSTIYDGITYNYTYGTNTIDVKYKNEDGEDRTIAYVLKDGKVVSKTSSYSKYTFDYASGKLQEYKEFDVDDNGNEDLEDDYKLTWSGANVTKIAKEGRSYEVTYSTIKGGSVAAALFLFGGGEVGHFPLDVDEIRRNAPILDKMGDMPEYLPSKVVETREYEGGGQLYE